MEGALEGGTTGGGFTAHHAHGVDEGEPVGLGFQRRLMDRLRMTFMRPLELLADQVRCLAAQDDPGAPQIMSSSSAPISQRCRFRRHVVVGMC